MLPIYDGCYLSKTEEKTKKHNTNKNMKKQKHEKTKKQKKRKIEKRKMNFLITRVLS